MIQNVLDKHKKLHYLAKCLRNFNNISFVNKVIEMDKDPYTVGQKGRLHI
jgi:hypothetical protein